MTKATKKKFGIFVGLYNQLRATKVSVKTASVDPAILAAFEQVADTIGQIPEVDSTSYKSTKRLSYESLDLPEIDMSVLHFINNNPGLSRREISQQGNFLLQTVCGSVNRLLDKELIYVSGRKWDEDTKRNVGVLSA